MITEIILLSLGVLALIISSYTDWKIREVPDFISYFLIFSTVVIRLIHSIITSDWSFFIYGIIGLAAGITIGFLMYYLGQWGGGDSKLLMGLFCAFATPPIFMTGNLVFNNWFMFNISFLINIIFAGAIYSLVYSIVIVSANIKKIRKEIKSVIKSNKKTAYFLAALFVICTIIAFIFPQLMIIFSGIAAIILILPIVFIYAKAVEKTCFIKKYPVAKLREGDWIVNEIKINGKTICSQKDLGISKDQIQMLKKHKIESVNVKEGIPFIPAFLIAFAITFFFGFSYMPLFF